MGGSQLLERWQAYKGRYPADATALRQILCALYDSRGDQQKFDAGLSRLQEHLSMQAARILGVNTADRQALTAWASAMGLIFLVKKEHRHTGCHVHT